MKLATALFHRISRSSGDASDPFEQRLAVLEAESHRRGKLAFPALFIRASRAAA